MFLLICHKMHLWGVKMDSGAYTSKTTLKDFPQSHRVSMLSTKSGWKWYVPSLGCHLFFKVILTNHKTQGFRGYPPGCAVRNLLSWQLAKINHNQSDWGTALHGLWDQITTAPRPAQPTAPPSHSPEGSDNSCSETSLAQNVSIS